MKSILAASAIAAVVLAGSSAAAPPAAAKGCIKGAIIGGLVGHMAGHGKVGVVAGCLIGHHEAVEKERERREQQRRAVHEH